MITSKMISRLNNTCTLWPSCYVAVTNICEFLKLSSIFLPIFSLTYFLLLDLVGGLSGEHSPFWTYLLQCCVHGN